MTSGHIIFQNDREDEKNHKKIIEIKKKKTVRRKMDEDETTIFVVETKFFSDTVFSVISAPK